MGRLGEKYSGADLERGTRPVNLFSKRLEDSTALQEDLEASVPSSTISSTAYATTQGKQTQIQARALRVLIEALDDLHRVRAQLLRRAQALADADDIRDRILKVSSGFERLVEVEPAMFEDVSDEELAKYDKFLKEMSEIEQKQSGILSDIQVCSPSTSPIPMAALTMHVVQSRNELFLQCRRDDPSVKDREHALQSLDLAYHKYREITRNLDEGFKVMTLNLLLFLLIHLVSQVL